MRTPMTTMSTTTKTTEVCLVCETSFISEGLPTGWRVKYEIPDDVSVCPWCVNRGWPKFRAMFLALSEIAHRKDPEWNYDAVSLAEAAEEALRLVVGVPPEAAPPTAQESAQEAHRASEGARKVVRRVKRRR